MSLDLATVTLAITASPPVGVDILREAARLWVEQQETAQQIWWCEQHELGGVTHGAGAAEWCPIRWGSGSPDPNECRMVIRLLAPSVVDE